MTKPIFLVGECWGEYEQRAHAGFVGPSGIELLRMMSEARLIILTAEDHSDISRFYKRGDPQAINAIWLRHPEFYRTNVFNHHPPANRLEYFCGTKKEGIPGYPALIKSGYVRAEFSNELDRLGDEILQRDPNLIIALGNTPLWALAGRTGVSKLRGTTRYTTHCVADFKLLSVYHPAAVLREWSHRPTSIIDFQKAIYESEYPEIRRPDCDIWIEPTLDDIETFINDYIIGCDLLSVDIETAGTRVTCIGFAPRDDIAIVIPFDDDRSANRSYWPTAADERRCWELVRRVVEDPEIKKLYQNGLYDVAFMLRAYGIASRGNTEDSMLCHHALQPEALKGLGYLGSIYTDFGAWKSERKVKETIKRDD